MAQYLLSLSLSLSLILLLFMNMGCEQAVEVSNEFGIENPVSTSHAELDPATLEILEAAYQQTPIEKSNWYTYGVLDRDRTDSFCYVAYSNADVYQEYSMQKIDGEWVLGELIKNESAIRIEKKSIQKTLSGTAYTKKIAEIFTGQLHNQLRDEWYVPGNHQETGIWTIGPIQYQTDLPTRAVFIEGTQIVGNKEHKIEWVGPWVWTRYSHPSGSQSSNNKNTFTEIFHNGVYYPSQELKATYRHRITEIGVPSVPTQISPANGFNAIGTSIYFSWSASSGGGTITYRLQISTQSNFSSLFLNQSGITNTNRSVSGFSPGTKYYWRVRAENEQGASAWSSVRSFTSPLSTPSVSASIQNGHPRVTWSSVQNANYYEIYKKIDTSSTWYLYGSTTGTTYTDIHANVSGYQGSGYPRRTPYVAYYVVARGNNGSKSSNSVQHYFDLSDITPLGDGEIIQ